MCMVSAVMDSGSTIPYQYWTPGTWQQFQDIIAKLDALDRKLNQPECHDPAKAAWMREIESRIKSLESK